MTNITESKLEYAEYATRAAAKKIVPMSFDQWLDNEFMEEAENLNNILGEGCYSHVRDFKMPKKVLKATADALKAGWINQHFEKTEGGYYYPWMIDDYGGFLDKEYEKRMTKKQREEAFLD